MNKVFAGVGAAAVVAAAAVAYMSVRGSAPVAPAAAISVTANNPMGQSIDPKDPGEIQYKKGLYPEALAYWTDQAAKGNQQAAHRLGVEYMDGKGGVVPGCNVARCPDYAKAMVYHKQAALAGNALSMFDIGSIFEYGLGVTADLAQAEKWYGYSANYGLAQGQYNFATMLESGEGGHTPDLIESYKFFMLAARGGFTGIPYDNRNFKIDRNAPLPTDLLRHKMTPAQIEEATERADAFKKITGPLQGE